MSHRSDAAAWAVGILEDPQAIILDTETTSLQGEVVELAVINSAGTTLFNQRFCPVSALDPAAVAIHGLSAEMLAHEPPFPAHFEQLRHILETAGRVVIYNAVFDTLALWRTTQLHQLPTLHFTGECAMEWYAQWFGEWSHYRHAYKWQKLEGGDHSALGDCLATLNLLKLMAGEL